PSRYASPVTRLLHGQQFDIEHQRRIRRNDAAGAACAIAEFRRNDQRALAPALHRAAPLTPPADNLPHADLEFERLVAVDRRVELLALLAVLVEPSRIMHDAGLAGLRRGAGAFLAVNDLQT